MLLLLLFLSVATFLLLILKIFAYGYFPSDDALRHVGKVISGKSWHEILVVRSAITMDSHPGWHALLTFFKETVTLSPVNLLNFSVLFLFLLFTLPPAFFLRRPEAWVATFILFAIFSPGPIYRLLYGRPFIFSMFLVLLFVFLANTISKRADSFFDCAFYIFGSFVNLDSRHMVSFAAPTARSFIVQGMVGGRQISHFNRHWHILGRCTDRPSFHLSVPNALPRIRSI